MRHCFLNSQERLKGVQEKNGHASYHITIGPYIHLTKKTKKKRPPISLDNLRKVFSKSSRLQNANT